MRNKFMSYNMLSKFPKTIIKATSQIKSKDESVKEGSS